MSGCLSAQALHPTDSMEATFPKSFVRGLTGLATPATGGRLAVSGNEQRLGGQEAAAGQLPEDHVH